MNEVGRFSDKQRSILDAQTADLRRFGKTLFTSCFETLKVDLEQNLDIEMKTSSHLTIAMKTDSEGQPLDSCFGAHLNVQNASVYFDTYRSHVFFAVKAQPFPSGKGEENWDQRLRRRYWQL